MGTDAVAAAQTPEPEPVPIVEAASAPVPRRSILGIKRPLAAAPTSSPIPTRVAPAWPKRVVYEPVKSVEWRNWDFLSPWEGAEKGFAALLPGDEKSKS